MQSSLMLGACAQELLQCVCLCLCVCECYHSSTSLRRVCEKLNLPAKSLLNAKGFQLEDFAEMLTFTSYSLFIVFARSSDIKCMHCMPNLASSIQHFSAFLLNLTVTIVAKGSCHCSCTYKCATNTLYSFKHGLPELER